jgi:hypothetical protein
MRAPREDQAKIGANATRRMPQERSFALMEFRLKCFDALSVRIRQCARGFATSRRIRLTGGQVDVE